MEHAPVVSARRWYQRTWLWMVVALLFTPLALLLVLLVTSILQLPTFVSVSAIAVISALTPIALWMGGLVARHGWVRGFLRGFTALLILLVAWTLWFSDGGQTIWIVFSVLWVAPLFVLFLFRSRFTPDDLMPLGKRAKRTLAFAVAPLLVLLGTLAGWNYVQQLEMERAAGETLVTVYRATGFIPEGTKGDLVLEERGAFADTTPFKSVPERGITTLAELEAVLTGRVATEPIQPNSILTRDQWVEEP